MIAFFGENNPTVEKARLVRHLGIKKFIPVFDRVKQEEVYKYPTGASFEKVIKDFPRYERGEYNYWSAWPTSKPKTLWAVSRVRRKRLGQKDFFKKIFKEN